MGLQVNYLWFCVYLWVQSRSSVPHLGPRLKEVLVTEAWSSQGMRQEGRSHVKWHTDTHTHTWSCLSDVEYVKSIVFHCLRQLTRPNSTSEEQRSFSGHSEARLGEERKKNRYYYHRGDRAWAWVTAGHFSGETHDCHFWEVLLNNFIHDFLCSAFFILDF